VDNVESSPGPDPLEDGDVHEVSPQAGDDPGGDVGGPHTSAGADAGDEESAVDWEPPRGNDPLRFNNWMKRSASGAVMTGIALGLQQALDARKDKPAFVMEAPGEPDDPDAPIDLRFDPDNPANTVAIIRHPVSERPPERPTPGS
jgi:hypothetical protein